MKRRYCPTGKLKYFNEPWADIAAEEQSERFGSPYKAYKCNCGWWHTFDKGKKRARDQQAESRRARRRRSERGDPPPRQVLRDQRRRAKDRAHKLRQRRKAELPLRIWEDDGGACIWPRVD